MTPPEDDDLTAAEYALGTLDRDERTAAERRRRSEPAFDQAVAAWEIRLAPLQEAVPDVDPAAHLWSAILARIRGLSGEPDPRSQTDGVLVLQLNHQLRTWKRATAACFAFAAVLAAWILVDRILLREPQDRTLVAVLLKTDESPAFVMRADLRDRQMSVRNLAAPAVPGRSYELWVIDPQLGAPRSLGVLGQADTPRHTLPNLPPDVLSRATYAITIEPAGGSPTGAPTSPPVFFGHLVASGT